MRILVTGASGRLGPFVVERLNRGGHRVFAWSGKARGSRGGIALRPVDLTDEREVDYGTGRVGSGGGDPCRGGELRR